MDEENDHPMGDRIRRHRKRRGLTLKELSEKSGLAVSTISKAERNQLSLTYDRFMNLTEALGLEVSDLFDRKKPSIGTDGIAIHRAGEGPTHQAGNYVYQLLCADLKEKHMVPMEGTTKAGQVSDFDHFGQHAGEEFIFVLDGVLEVHIGSRKKIVLNEGDSMYFNSWQPHLYLASKESQTARFIAVCWQPTRREEVDRTVTKAPK
jgi:transcriptional regulator with XRE-family HTH domain